MEHIQNVQLFHSCYIRNYALCNFSYCEWNRLRYSISSYAHTSQQENYHSVYDFRYADLLNNLAPLHLQECWTWRMLQGFSAPNLRSLLDQRQLWGQVECSSEDVAELVETLFRWWRNHGPVLHGIVQQYHFKSTIFAELPKFLEEFSESFTQFLSSSGE